MDRDGGPRVFRGSEAVARGHYRDVAFADTSNERVTVSRSVCSRDDDDEVRVIPFFFFFFTNSRCVV